MIPFGSARNEHRVFLQLMQTVPGLEERLFSGASQEDVLHMADYVRFSPFQLLFFLTQCQF
jgi:hypothetical protein